MNLITQNEQQILQDPLKDCNKTLIEELKDLGFKNASKIAGTKGFPQISQERIIKFILSLEPMDFTVIQSDLRIKGCCRKPGSIFWVETKIEDYNKIPPQFVLEKLKLAQQAKCFDYYTVAQLEKEVKVPDPILFGRIEGDSNRYFIAQWDNDLRLDDL